MSRTITRLYDSYADAKATLRALEAAGVPRADISLVANNAIEAHGADTHNESGLGAEVGAGVGAVAGSGAGLLAGLGMLAIPGLGPVVAAGWLAALAIGAAGGATAGGLLGALVGAGIENDNAEVYTEGVRRGGTLISVRVPEDRASEIAAIMDTYRAVDVAGRRIAYAEAGWTGYDPAARAYSPEEIERERATYR